MTQGTGRSRRRRPATALVAPVRPPDRLDEPEAPGASTRLRAACGRECPWDREQDERSIVPHTSRRPTSCAAAAHAGDDAKLLDELGDVLFQVYFLSLLLEERGAGSLAEVAEHVHAKLVRRHPHIFGEVEVDSAGDVLRNWDAIKKTEAGREPGIFGEVPENLPGPLYARKVQRRAASTGFDFDHVPYECVRGSSRSSSSRIASAFHEVGDVLFAAVNVARKLKVDRSCAAGGAALPRRVQAPRTSRRATARLESLADAQLQYYARRGCRRG